MKMEDHFKETLNRAVTNEPPVLDAWDRFERRMGRSRRWRMVAGLAGAAAVIVAAVIVVPQLGTGRNPVIPDLPGPSATPTVDPYPGWETFENAERRYRVRYPSDWGLSSFEGHWEITPPGLHAVGGGGVNDSFGIDIAVEDRNIFFGETGVHPFTDRGTRSDGREFLLNQVDHRASGGRIYQLVYLIDWSDSQCGIDEGDCADGDDQVLRVVVQGDGTTDLPDRYGAEAGRVYATIERLEGSGVEPMTKDRFTDALVEFMDARIAGSGAEVYLTAEMKQAYEKGTDDLPAYLYRVSPMAPLGSYVVLSRQSEGANLAVFRVRIVTTPTDGSPQDAYIEQIEIAPGANYLGEQRAGVIQSARYGP